MSKKKKNEFLRSVKDRVETIQDMDKSKKIMAGGVIGIVALAAIIGVSMSGKSARSVATETTASVESSTTAAPVAAAQVMPMEKAGNEFPSLGIEVETEEPRPELLEEGVQHSYIEKVQERLMQLGFMDNDEPTNYFGEVTKAAVMIFQRQNGLAQDGIIGPSTLPLLMDENAKHYAAKLGDVGEDVKRIQNRLYELGYLASADMIKSYTKPILKDRLDVLPGLKTTDYKTFVNMANYFSQIADVANASYDMVIVDVSQEIPNDVQMRILNISDLVLVGVNQSLAAVNNFLKLKIVEPFFQKSNVVIEIGKYNPYSKYSAKNIGRILREKNIPWTVPYNINFSDHASEGKIIDYLLGAKMLNDPNNQDYSFYTSVAGVADSIDYKLKELQYLK